MVGWPCGCVIVVAVPEGDFVVVCDCVSVVVSVLCVVSVSMVVLTSTVF